MPHPKYSATPLRKNDSYVNYSIVVHNSNKSLLVNKMDDLIKVALKCSTPISNQVNLYTCSSNTALQLSAVTKILEVR